MLLFVVMGIAVSGIAALIPFGNLLTQMVFGQLMMLALPLALYFLITRQRPRNVIALEPIPIKLISWVFVLSLAFIPLYELLGQLLGLVFATPINTEMATIVGTAPLAVLLLLGAVLPGIFEELILRSVFFQEFHKNPNGFPIFKTAILVAIFTALMIGNIHLAVAGFLSSFAFFYLLYYTRNVVVSMLSHLMLNAYMFVKFSSESYLEFSRALTVGSMGHWLGLAFVSLAAVGIIYYIMKKFRNYHVVTIGHSGAEASTSSGPIVKSGVFSGVSWIYWITVGLLLVVMVTNELGAYFA
jgi:membrane protease YdiL (CAAX protease family)